VSWIPELPLLRRELTELANRRRTYIVRVVGAMILLFFVFLAYSESMGARQRFMGNAGLSGSMQYMGVGGDVFARITPLLFYTIQILMPALCCACVTAEKENNTLGTLMLTRLSSGTIILEKFGSRLVPMLTLLLLTFPVLAHVHTLGGVDTDLLIGTLWLLFCECLLFASVAIACSTWFTTTVMAFIWSYVLIGFLAALTLSLGYTTFVPSAIWRTAFVDSQWGISRSQMAVLGAVGMGPAVTQSSWLITISKSVPALLVTAVLLLFARLTLVRRAFVSQASALLKALRVVDVFFTALNEHTTGGIELVRDSNPLPGDDPVAWRERNKKSLGKARYLFRVLVVLEIPTLFICVLAATVSARNAFQGLYVLQGLIWTLAVLVTAVKAATLFSSERAKQTIEPLLATPLSGVELLSQKVVGMRRLLIVLSVPILTVNLTQFLLGMDLNRISANVIQRPLIYLLLSICATFVLLYLVTWLSAGIGLKIHSQTKAVLASVTVVAAWTVIPLVIVQFFRLDPPATEFATSFSPYSAVAATEQYLIEPFMRTNYNQYGIVEDIPRLLWACCVIAAYAVFTLVIRLVVRKTCPFLLSRRENPAELPPASVKRQAQVAVLEGTP
jgi:ABC-type transport system involved in multi-copper enzyme maturation permease subunit